MSGNLLLIGKSGAMAARSALDLTAQNIANAANADYSRRTLSMEEVAAKGGIGFEPSSALSGVRPDQVLRTNSVFLQNEARRTSGDLARANAELSGLANAESAIEQAGIYPALVDIEASLARLASDPLGGALRAAVVEDARRLAQTFQIATSALDIAEADLRFSADAGVDQANLLSGEIARTNAGIASARAGSSNMAALHDQRDALLRDLSQLTGATAAFDALGRATVSVDGQVMVSGVDSFSLSLGSNPDGSFAFSFGGSAVNLASGSLLGGSQAMQAIGTYRTRLDDLAAQVITTVNGAQANGVTVDGTPAPPFFNGSTARDIAMALTSGGQIATASAGQGPGSRDIGNLQALRNALAGNGPAKSADTLLFDLSSAISARSITRDALRTLADSAEISLSAETGVDLDQEAANLLRYQQMFQASGRVMQTASDIFDTILGIGR